MNNSVVRRLAGAASAAALAALLVGGFTGADAGGGVLGTGVSPSRMVDEEVDCTEALPDGLSVRGVSDDGAGIDLDVTVLLDGVDAARAEKLMGIAQRSFTPLGITVKPTFQAVSFQGKGASVLIGQARDYVGGAVPAGTDIVHVLTSKNIEEGGNTGVAGMADCIGGIKSPLHAFSVAEFDLGEGIRVGPVGMFLDMGARVTAHELAHLMGAHHHYANCVEGSRSAVAQTEAATCTLMINLADLAVTNFSTVNAAVVRAHAVDYAG